MAFCESVTKSGRRCKVAVYKLDGHFCLIHSTIPEAVELKRSARAKGASAPKKPRSKALISPSIQGSADVLLFLNKVKAAYGKRQLSTEQVTTYASLARTFDQVLRSERIDLKIEAMEKQLEELKKL